MRSNDIWLGVPYDYFVFTSLQTKMAMELGVDVGEYTHFAGSLHLYKRDLDRWLKKQQEG
jgi:thymidylate synthase